VAQSGLSDTCTSHSRPLNCKRYKGCFLLGSWPNSLPVIPEVNGYLFNPFEPQKMAHVYRLLPGVLGHFWRRQSGISVRNGSIGVDLLDRSTLCKLFVFAGVVRAPIATQTGRTGVPELGYSPLPLLDGGEFISEVDCRDANFYLTHPFLDLVSARIANWQTAHARVGGVQPSNH